MLPTHSPHRLCSPSATIPKPSRSPSPGSSQPPQQQPSSGTVCGFYLPAGALLGQGPSYLSDWISSVSPQARALVLVEAWEASWASDFPLISASRRIHSLPQICPFCLRVLHGCMRELQPLSPRLESRGPATPTHSWLSHRINTTF